MIASKTFGSIFGYKLVGDFLLTNQRTISICSWVFKSCNTASCLLLTTAFLGAAIGSVNAQSITPANDGVGTSVIIDDNSITIDGGTQSGNNLFHSFEQFGLSEAQTAIFLSNPEIINILGRVVGNEASVIDGLISVIGGNSNLFLMNPSGIIFGQNAQLNIPGDFTATTATGIGFGNGNFFNAVGDNDFSTLTGTPSEFAFNSLDTNGSITISTLPNSSFEIAVDSSDAGTITISTTPGSSIVRIEQSGNLLSLEIDPPRNADGEIMPFTVGDLPQLLTGNLPLNDFEANNPNVPIQTDDENVLIGNSDTGGQVTTADGIIGSIDGIIGVDIDNDGVPDIPTGVTTTDVESPSSPPITPTPSTPSIPITPPPSTSSPITPEEESELNREIITFPEPTSPEPLVNTTIVFQPDNQDPIAILDKQVAFLDQSLTRDYGNYYDSSFISPELESEVSLAQIQQELIKIEEATGVNPAIIYAVFYPSEVTSKNNIDQVSFLPQPSDELELVAITAKGEAIRQRVAGAERAQVIETANRFTDRIFFKQSEEKYLPDSEQLYQWLVEPLIEELEAREIDNLVFILDSGIRSLPIAALHDGEKYLIEEYSVGMMPSFRLTNTKYQDIRDVEILAMGADNFPDPELSPLPAVPTELEIIVRKLWDGQDFFLNEDFTIDNLRQTQTSRPFGILHLATHAEFLPGKPPNSFIQFGDRKLGLDELRELQLNNPLVQLMVLSACKTALGDRDAEYGFASLAYQAGVKSALGSLWYVSDSGTLSLMTKFYQELKDSPIKAEALRQAQLGLLKGEVRLENGKLILEDFEFDLPPEIQEEDLTHPLYWSGFTIIGNPW